jgi:hypothetical protein
VGGAQAERASRPLPKTGDSITHSQQHAEAESVRSAILGKTCQHESSSRTGQRAARPKFHCQTKRKAGTKNRAIGKKSRNSGAADSRRDKVGNRGCCGWRA